MKQELYTLEGRPGLWRVLPFSIQQLLAMFVNNLVPRKQCEPVAQTGCIPTKI